MYKNQTFRKYVMDFKNLKERMCPEKEELKMLKLYKRSNGKTNYNYINLNKNHIVKRL